MVEVVVTGAFESWQQAARELLRRGVPPGDVTWIEGPAARGLVAEQTPDERSKYVVPRRFVELARTAASHSSDERWATMYRVLWRLVHENRALLDLLDDPDVRALTALQPQQPAMPGFELEPPPPVKAAPRGTPPAAPDLPFTGAGAPPPARTDADTRAADSHVHGAGMAAGASAADLGELAAAAVACTRCDLYKHATQMVFGKGPSTAPIVLVGEQPGDQEDLQGAPFVGPAGEVLDRALAEIGLDRRSVYITNIVKHFKWEPRGKRRIHMTPRANEIQACRPWLEAELAFVKPRVIVCLGSTAAQALIGAHFRITKSRGQFYRSQWAPWVMGTYHPSAVLRAEDPAGADVVYRWLVEDIGHAAKRATEAERSASSPM